MVNGDRPPPRRFADRGTDDGQGLRWRLGPVSLRPNEILAGLLGVSGAAAALAGVGSIATDTILVGLGIGALVALPVLAEGWLRRRRRVDGVQTASSESAPADKPAASPIPRRSTFRGRQAELDCLIANHEDERAARAMATPGKGPVVLSVYGMPGVGKTELVKELAIRLAPEYPHGLVSATFNQAGLPIPPAEIIKDVLGKLGWPPAQIPPDFDGRRTLLRTLTAGRRIIFIFDAARNPAQVQAVMPTEPGCAVFITSRLDLAAGLGLPPSCAMALAVPSAEDAVDMLAAHGNIDWLADADTASEVVDLCGRLPLAIRSVAERMSHDNTTLRYVAARLRPRETRLGRLGQPGRSVIEGVETEFGRLTAPEQNALCLLSLVGSRTFIPWVLRPLLNVVEREAESVMAALGAAQLLQQAEFDGPTGLPRYEFNPLVRLFAEAELRQRLGAGELLIEPAHTDLVDAYLEFATAVLLARSDGYRSNRRWRWVTRRSGLHDMVARSPERGIRLEYRNLVRTVQSAETGGDHATCWRVAARLQGSVPEDLDLDATLAAFDAGERAARREGHIVGRLDVCLSRASLYVALEDYAAALTELDEIAVAAGSLSDGDKVAVLAKVYRIRGMGFVQLGSYGQARRDLADATAQAEAARNEGERRLVALLQAECDRVPCLDFANEGNGVGEVEDSVYFRARLDEAETARRAARGSDARDTEQAARRWYEARHALQVALRHSAGDLRRSAAVYYRLARLCIDQRRAIGEPRFTKPKEKDSPYRLARQALIYAAQAVVAFRHMNNRIGAIRAQCLQIRALTAAGKLIEAERLCTLVEWELNRYVPEDSPAWRSLQARFLRARGERLMEDDTTATDGRQDLKEAATIFAELEDWYSHDEVWRFLRK